MPSSAWTTRPSLIAKAIISRAATIVDGHSPYNTFQECWKTLEHIRVLINEISPERRRKIQIAAERGACKHDLPDLELELERYISPHRISSLWFWICSIVSLVSEYRRLYRLYEEYPFFLRRFLSTHLHNDILDFRDQVIEFFNDAWVNIPLHSSHCLILMCFQKTTALGDRSINWGAIAQMACWYHFPDSHQPPVRSSQLWTLQHKFVKTI